MQKASDVLGGLDAGDDAEWAAAAGREGLAEVDQAINRFESLVDIFVAAVEDLQLRSDASEVSAESMNDIVAQVERISTEWQKIKKTLRVVKHQVELAMEFEELRNVTIGDIELEIDSLSRAIFEMEERRHQSSFGATRSQDEHVDLNDLESMVQESTAPPGAMEQTTGSHRNLDVLSTPQSPELPMPSEDSTLLGLFASMQPLRASLDFLPMKLSTFNGRANHIFPSACTELEDRRENLEQQWSKLEADADSLRREFGEDRWNLVFRNAGKQAIKMIESVERTLAKVDESLGHNTRLRHSSATVRKIESYEAKKLHLCPAIERVLGIVERGVKDRLTVNGEIVRLRADLRQKWQTLQIEMRSMDVLLDEYASDTGFNQQQLRDSVSTILSTERSLDSSTLLTPGSSPPSSMGDRSRRGSQQEGPRPISFTKTRDIHTNAASAATTTPLSKRFSSLPTPHAKPPTSRSSALDLKGAAGSPSSSTSTPNSARSYAQRALATPPDNRPRWSYVKTAGSDYNVSAYYQSLMAKGKGLHRSAHRQSSAPNPHAPASSPLSTATARSTSATSTPGPSSRTTSRNPPLHRKRSDLHSAARAASSAVSSATARRLSVSSTSSTPRNAAAAAAATTPRSRTAMSSSRSVDKGRSMIPLPTGSSPGSTHSRSRNASASTAGWDVGSD